MITSMDLANNIGTFIAAIAFLFGMGVAWGILNKSVNDIKETLEKEIKPDLKNIRERFGTIEDRVNTLWKDKYAPATSPRKLNIEGEKILEESGIKEIIESKKDFLLEKILESKPATAYDAESCIAQVVDRLPELCPDIIEDLKNGAFRVGQSIDVVLFVGSIYLRDIIFKDLGFSIKDIDKNSQS